MRSQELALEQTRLANTRAVLEAQLETAKARRQYEREQPLAAKGFVAGKQFADTTDQYAYERKRLAAVKNSQSTAERLKASQPPEQPRAATSRESSLENTSGNHQAAHPTRAAPAAR